ncbi:MAG TPA: NADP oxidoreductase [Aggregatilineaceae bacterium]|nr:NADP oxidoreductase [Aggregatilineaceae bacterium]
MAPDHPKIKSVTRTYDRIAANPLFRFYGNVAFGKDLCHSDLTHHYHAIIYATGAQTDRQMRIPGENLPGSHAATELVGWYNAHPDYRDLKFDLSVEKVAVIGNGNVAMDVVRMLARTPSELATTDIADYALEALKQSRVKEIYVIGRRGPAQASFTNPEIQELEELEGADVMVASEEVELDPLSREYIASGVDRTAEKNVQILERFSQTPPKGRARQIIVRFLLSPAEIIGQDRVEAIRLIKNEICEKEHMLRPCPTDETEIIEVGAVFRSIGYQGVPLPEVPFDEMSATIANIQGRVISPAGEPILGEYVVGWIKRGPSGVIGTNKPDAQETVDQLLQDAQAGALLQPAEPTREALECLLQQRGIDYVTYEDWRIIDQIEQQRGATTGRPRCKFSRVEDMLAALHEHKTAPEQPS